MALEKDFFDQVFQVVRLIPRGRITNYGAIAKYLGSPKSSRVVGYAMNASHEATPKVPAHRVVNRNGMLTGKMHFSTPHLMEELLLKEGIQVKNDKVSRFDAVFWDPSKELNI
ncbi:MAG: MGMT family protein [Bacteroidetes bacterium]|jgi:methylated-DNA-protein-cysteine methyltransferase-like protein|nr:MGMT family protein [Bacteroidota bacterium]MCA6442064.1 MGMT family protein [Bacteroidota bacterium]